MQLIALLLSVTLAIVPLLCDSFYQSLTDSYYFEETEYWQLVDAPLSILFTVVLLIANLAILNAVLSDYSDLQANGRIAMFQFIISLAVLLLRLK